MKKYRVWAQSISMCYLDVEAEDEDDAYRQGKDADGGIFIEDEGRGDWSIVEVKEKVTKPDP